MFETVLLFTLMEVLLARFSFAGSKVWVLLDHCRLLVAGKVLQGWKNIKVAFVLKGHNLIQPVGFFFLLFYKKTKEPDKCRKWYLFLCWNERLTDFSSSPVCIVVLRGGPLILWALCLPSTIYTLFPFFFLKAQKSVPEVSIRKVRRRLSVFTLIAGSDLLSVVKDIAGSVALSLTRVNWVSFSFSQQHRADRIKKREERVFLWAPNLSQLCISCFFLFLLSHRQNGKGGSCIF